jgi:hypothetical protein
MSSSTSSSNDRLPAGRPWASLALAMLLLAAALGASEAFWRARGFQPGVIDSADFWSLHRMDVYSWDGRPRLVLIGSSRAQQGIEPAILQKAMPGWRVVDLNITGNTALPFVQDLCNDPKFNGVILMETATMHLFRPQRAQQSAEYIDCYHKFYGSFRFANRILDTALKAWIQSKLTIVSAELRLDKILAARGSLRPDEEAAYLYMRYDRYRTVNLRMRLHADLLARLRAFRMRLLGPELQAASAHMTPERFPGFLATELTPYARRLEARGGKLIMLCLPVTGPMRQTEEAAFPKAKYWDRIEPLTSVPTIHYTEDRLMASLDCPDTSHVDSVDAPRLTRRLAAWIEAKLKDPKATPDAAKQ